MPDLFISYSRSDKAFVEKLDKALQERGKDAWVDWADIHPSAEWLKEILGAIEAASAVVLVLSPRFAKSKVCADETDHALKHNKRIVPIVIDDFDQGTLSASVLARQWIHCRNTDNFDEAVSSLISAIDTDLDWVQSHTRLLARALEWEQNKKDSSFALRGRDLKRAETSLTLHSAKEPQFTSQQIDFILSSRRDSNRRLLSVIGAAAVALVALSVVGLLFWQKRQEQALTLAANFRETGILQLAANNPLAAENLFAHALEINATSGAVDRLEQARAKSPKLLWISPQIADATVLAISTNGKLFALQTPSDLELWNIETRQKMRTILAEGGVRIAAFSADNRTFALGYEKKISVWNLASNNPLPSLSIPTRYPATSLNFDPTGKYISVGLLNGDISVWDASIKTQLPYREFHGHTDRVTSTAITKDGHLLVSGSWDDTVKIWDLIEGKELNTLVGHDDSVLSVALSPHDDLIASAGWDATILIWDLKTGKQLRAMAGHQGSILSLAFSPGGDWLASTSEDRTVRLWDVEKGSHLLTLSGHASDVSAVAFLDSNGVSELTTGDMGGVVRLWSLGDIGQRDELQTFRGDTAAITMLSFATQYPLLASSSVDKTIRIWNLEAKGAPRVLPKQLESVSAVQFSPDGRHCASATKEAFVRVWDIDTGNSQIFSDDQSSAGIRYLTYSHDGSLLAAGSDDGWIRIFNVSDGKIVSRFLGHAQKVQGLAFNAADTLLASSSDNSTIKLWRTSDWTLVRELTGHRSGVYQVTFSPDGRFLLSTSDDKTARLWEVISGKELIDLACTRFRRHRVRCFDGTGGESWRDGSLHASSSLRLCG